MSRIARILRNHGVNVVLENDKVIAVDEDGTRTDCTDFGPDELREFLGY